MRRQWHSRDSFSGAEGCRFEPCRAHQPVKHAPHPRQTASASERGHGDIVQGRHAPRRLLHLDRRSPRSPRDRADPRLLTETRPPASRAGAGGRGSAAVLAVAVLFAAAFSFSFWGRNAEGVGRHDAGVALALSFAVPLAFYASLGWAVVALAGAVVAWRRRRSPMRWLQALAVSLLPALLLLVIDLWR